MKQSYFEIRCNLFVSPSIMEVNSQQNGFRANFKIYFFAKSIQVWNDMRQNFIFE